MKLVKVKAGWLALSKQTPTVVVAPTFGDAMSMMFIAIMAEAVRLAEEAGVINNIQASRLLKDVPKEVFRCRRQYPRPVALIEHTAVQS